VEINVIKNPFFKRENEAFQTISVDLKHKSLANVDHTAAIEPENLKKKKTPQAWHRIQRPPSAYPKRHCLM
jgi:hypothetical protein